MFEASFSIYNFEFFLAVLLRIGGAVYTAPIFSSRSVPPRVRLFLSVALALFVTGRLEYEPLPYTTTVGFTMVLIKELVTGMSIGLMGAMIFAVLSMAGQFIDREMGFAMASTFDQINGGQSTITADMYSNMVMLIMVISGLHYFVLVAVTDSFDVIPVHGAVFQMDTLYQMVIAVLRDYFIIAMRISMPIFIAATMLNVILGILAKASPQLSMFSIGMQLKVFMGLGILFLTIGLMPDVTNYIYGNMKDFMTNLIKSLY